ncbi:MAG: hypothetical protein ACYCSS_01785 [Sulfuriferula sp.]
MKAGREHVVPLSDSAISILRGIQPSTSANRCVFSGVGNAERTMSENTVNKATLWDAIRKYKLRVMASVLLDKQGCNLDAIGAQLAHNGITFWKSNRRSKFV